MMDHQYSQCNLTIVLHACLAGPYTGVHAWSDSYIASLIGATRVCYRAHSYAIAISWSIGCMHG